MNKYEQAEIRYKKASEEFKRFVSEYPSNKIKIADAQVELNVAYELFRKEQISVLERI